MSDQRIEARAAVLAAANAFRQHRNRTRRLRVRGYLPVLPPFTARHIHQAVFLCRQRLLVSPEVLVAAGFLAVRA